MSGARLDIAAIAAEDNIKDRFGVTAPDYPLADLPLSLVMDFFALGYTVPVAMLRKLKKRIN